MIAKEQAKAYEIMGADVKQTGEQFGNSAKYLRWQDKAANQKFFAGELQAFSKEAADLLSGDRHHQAGRPTSPTSSTRASSSRRTSSVPRRSAVEGRRRSHDRARRARQRV